jgi:hypothetical protein
MAGLNELSIPNDINCINPPLQVVIDLKSIGIRDNRRVAGLDRGRMPTKGDTEGSRD